MLWGRKKLQVTKTRYEITKTKGQLMVTTLTYAGKNGARNEVRISESKDMKDN